MNEFIEEFRRELARLGVPDPVANEMAADLTADLKEAEAEGASAEHVLGTAAFDPKAFAGAWAAERGLVGIRPPAGSGRLPGRRLPSAIGVFAVVAIAGAILLLHSSSTTTQRLALPAPLTAPRVRVVPFPLPRLRRAGTVVTPWMRLALGPRRIAPPPVPSPAARVVVDIRGPGFDGRALGTVLLVVGLAGVLLSTLFAVWGRPLRRTA